MSNKSLRETVLEQQVKQLQLLFAQLKNISMRNIVTIVHYCGGTITLGEADYKAAVGLLLTEEVDQAAKTITFCTRQVGLDGGNEQGEVERGGLLPPNAGTHDEQGGLDGR